MRILMITCNSGLQDGINRHILAIAPAINRMQGCEVAVCTTYVAGEFNAALEKVGVKSYALGLPNGHDLRTWRRFRKVMRDFAPDIIHAHVLGLLERYYLGLFCKDIPIVTTCHGLTDAEMGLSQVTRKDKFESVLSQLGPKPMGKTIFISRGVAIAKGCPGGVIAYNPVAFDVANAKKGTNILRTELHLSVETPIIGTACRISLPKQPKLFVDVMCRVLLQRLDAHAVVCGTAHDMTLMSELEKQVADSGVGNRFHWLGYRKDALQITKELDCFIMTSATEGMPTALLEAMSVKTPIAFMRGKGGLIDLDEFSRSEGPIGVVSDAGDCAGLAAGIATLLKDKKLSSEYAEHAFVCGLKHFHVSDIAMQIVEIYQEMIGK